MRLFFFTGVKMSMLVFWGVNSLWTCRWLPTFRRNTQSLSSQLTELYIGNQWHIYFHRTLPKVERGGRKQKETSGSFHQFPVVAIYKLRNCDWKIRSLLFKATSCFSQNIFATSHTSVSVSNCAVAPCSDSDCIFFS